MQAPLDSCHKALHYAESVRIRDDVSADYAAALSLKAYLTFSWMFSSAALISILPSRMRVS